MATITISNLHVNGVIGTLPSERVKRQELILCVEFDYDAALAAANDDLTASVDYSAVEKCVVQCVETTSFFLLEALTAEIARRILQYDAVTRVKISVAKPGASAFGALISYSEEFFGENRA